MEHLASRFTDKLVQWNIVKSEDRELYVYGFWQGKFTKNGVDGLL